MLLCPRLPVPSLPSPQTPACWECGGWATQPRATPRLRLIGVRPCVQGSAYLGSTAAGRRREISAAAAAKRAWMPRPARCASQTAAHRLPAAPRALRRQCYARGRLPRRGSAPRPRALQTASTPETAREASAHSAAPPDRARSPPSRRRWNRRSAPAPFCPQPRRVARCESAAGEGSCSARRSGSRRPCQSAPERQSTPRPTSRAVSARALARRLRPRVRTREPALGPRRILWPPMPAWGHLAGGSGPDG